MIADIFPEIVLAEQQPLAGIQISPSLIESEPNHFQEHPNSYHLKEGIGMRWRLEERFF